MVSRHFCITKIVNKLLYTINYKSFAYKKEISHSQAHILAFIQNEIVGDLKQRLDRNITNYSVISFENTPKNQKNVIIIGVYRVRVRNQRNEIIMGYRNPAK